MQFKDLRLKAKKGLKIKLRNTDSGNYRVTNTGITLFINNSNTGQSICNNCLQTLENRQQSGGIHTMSLPQYPQEEPARLQCKEVKFKQSMMVTLRPRASDHGVELNEGARR